MKLFARAVATGFALALGSALFRKVADQIGLGDKKDKPIDPDPLTADGATDPGLRRS
ncbi:MAG TPA: hypothetical protein VGM88_18685 [Kofleriaceae bacterium]|jgi:hypothetical protein